METAGSELQSYLKNRAIRICASDAVANAIRATSEVSGPVFVIPYGIDLPVASEEDSSSDRIIDVVIGGLKLPELAHDVQTALAKKNFRVECLIDWMPRAAYVERLRRARVAVVLPRTTEGFYLPALEAMACGCVVVCPDCIGNRDFCHDGLNCFRPQHNLADIVSAATAARGLTPAKRSQMRENAKATVLQHSMETERAKFFQILDRVEELWGS